LRVPLEREAPRFVLPPDTIKVEESGEFSFTLVREAGAGRRGVAQAFAVGHQVGFTS